MSCQANPLPSHIPVPLQAVSDVHRWYAVYTYPRHEKVVTEQLESQSVEAFLPTFVTQSRWKDRRVRIQTPVFPGYVFTRIKSAERSKVFNIPGVLRILSFNGVLTPIDDSEIDAVKLCLERGGTLKPHPFIEVGERVRVRSGMLEGLEGLVTRCKNNRILILPIALINQSVAVEVDAVLLEPLAAKVMYVRYLSREQI
jgi:transcription antitermination factor NusG